MALENFMTKTAITPTRAQDYSQWYQQVIKAADMAENSVVRGCMVIKPYGYGIWEQIQATLDKMIKDTGHENFYCPIFVPLSFLEKEAAHVDGFAKECAVVTHHKLTTNANGELQPDGKLEEPLIIRPTSEALIGEMYSRWIQSYRDLPLLYNQWANVVRWEMRTRIFLRTSEFLWQEGHTAHASSDEALAETKLMLQTYVDLVENHLAIPLYYGEKTASEKFPGADITYTIEALMQDNKVLQGGTSHYLGQNFAKAFNIKFADKDGSEKYVYTSSWGVSTRLIGSLIMVHGDDDGIKLPPKIAPLQVCILPLLKAGQDNEAILTAAHQLSTTLQQTNYQGKNIRTKVDTRELRPGEKAWSWVKKGVPVRVEIGQRELESKQVCISLRTQAYGMKQFMALDDFIANITQILTDIQNSMFNAAQQNLHKQTQEISSKDEFYAFFQNNGGFALAPWIDEPQSEQQIKQDLKVSPRCVPLTHIDKVGTCIFTGKTGARYTLFARAY